MESDSLGTKEIPADAYYGIQSARALENFAITGYRLNSFMIGSLAMIKKSCAEANIYVGILDPRIGRAIIAAAEEVMEGRFHDQFVVDVIQGGAGTSINMNANEVIANRAIEILGGRKGDYTLVSPNTHVNMSQSTNDVFPTAIRISALKMAAGLEDALRGLLAALEAKSREFDDVLKVGRTHLQDAVPIRLGQEFAAYAKMIARDRVRLKRSLEELQLINMGATATGTGLNCDVNYALVVTRRLREITGLDLIAASDLVDATQNLDALADVSARLKILALSLSKIANDLRLLASGPRAGLAEINLPPVQPGSSIMPGKVNPVIAEVVNQISFQVAGNDLTIGLAVGAGQLELNVMEPVAAYNLLQSIAILTNGINIFTEKCIRGITANRERCKEYLENSIGVITALNPHVGYEQAAALAHEALVTGKTVRELLREKQIFTDEEIDTIFNVKEMTMPGIAGRRLLKTQPLLP
ncbi:aspartate ammonia-lyase [Hydrogenispora ethanolica]|nr:aspartate ammonia-lyase [Hydrogenispora ethanolica]